MPDKANIIVKNVAELQQHQFEKFDSAIDTMKKQWADNAMHHDVNDPIVVLLESMAIDTVKQLADKDATLLARELFKSGELELQKLIEVRLSGYLVAQITARGTGMRFLSEIYNIAII